MRYVAILTGPDTYLDHLGVLSALLKIPLIVTEEKTFQAAKHYYPEADTSLKYLEELSIAYLAEHFDVIFETGKFWAAQLKPFIELLFHKKIRFVYCPHGNSDKGHSFQNHAEQDIALVYGDHLRDLLTHNGSIHKIKHLPRTGNYRYSYYLNHRAFYDTLAEKEVFSRFKQNKPTILYAPTWQDRENPTSFFAATDALIEQLSDPFNVIIKLHPFLVEDFPAQVLRTMARYENHPSALFLTDFPPIYPLLSRCALYLGDYSSIGYDFLAFDRPLYFLNPKKGNYLSPLHSCGLELPPGENLGNFILNSLDECEEKFREQRRKVYTYAFGKEVLPESLFNEISSLV